MAPFKDYPRNYTKPEKFSTKIETGDDPLIFSKTIDDTRGHRFPDPNIHSADEHAVALPQIIGEVEVVNNQDEPLEAWFIRSLTAKSNWGVYEGIGPNDSDVIRNVTVPDGDSHTIQEAGWPLLHVYIEFPTAPSGNNSTDVIFREA